jgi:hypothetical protein
LHPLSNGGLREPNGFADVCVRPAPVNLELFDDGLGDLIEPQRLRFCGHTTIIATNARNQQGKPQKREQKTAES